MLPLPLLLLSRAWAAEESNLELSLEPQMQWEIGPCGLDWKDYILSRNVQ